MKVDLLSYPSNSLIFSSYLTELLQIYATNKRLPSLARRQLHNKTIHQTNKC